MNAPELTEADRAELGRRIDFALRRADEHRGDQLQELLDRLESAVELAAAVAVSVDRNI